MFKTPFFITFLCLYLFYNDNNPILYSLTSLIIFIAKIIIGSPNNWGKLQKKTHNKIVNYILSMNMLFGQ